MRIVREQMYHHFLDIKNGLLTQPHFLMAFGVCDDHLDVVLLKDIQFIIVNDVLQSGG